MTMEEMIKMAIAARKNSFLLYVMATAMEQRLMQGQMPDDVQGLVAVLKMLASDSLLDFLKDATAEELQSMNNAYGELAFGYMQKAGELFMADPQTDIATMAALATEMGIDL